MTGPTPSTLSIRLAPTPCLYHVGAERTQLTTLRVAPETCRRAHRAEVSGTLVRAREHNNQPYPFEFTATLLIQHPGQEPLQYQPALTMCHDGQTAGRASQRDGFQS